MEGKKMRGRCRGSVREGRRKKTKDDGWKKTERGQKT